MKTCLLNLADQIRDVDSLDLADTLCHFYLKKTGRYVVLLADLCQVLREESCASEKREKLTETGNMVLL